jgi:hypothetical protein
VAHGASSQAGLTQPASAGSLARTLGLRNAPTGVLEHMKSLIVVDLGHKNNQRDLRQFTRIERWHENNH